MIKKLSILIKILKDQFRHNWFFVLTDRNFYKSYSKYGETLTKNSILTKINKLVKNNEK